jgi:hypothetical protein
MTGTRWMGAAGAVLFVAYLLAHPATDAASVRDNPYAVIHAFGAAAMTLIVVGMLGIAESLWQRVGRLGRIAYLMAFIGSVLWVGMLFFDAFVNPVLAAYAPELVHPGLERTIDLYGPALILAGLCLILFFAGYVGLGISMARHGVVTMPTAALLALGAAVFDVGPVAHGVDALMIERIGGPLFAIGFVLLMRGRRDQSAVPTEPVSRST